MTIECLLRPFEVKPFAFDPIVPPVPRKRKQEPPVAIPTAAATPMKKTKGEAEEGDAEEEEDNEEQQKQEDEKQEAENEATPIAILPSVSPSQTVPSASSSTTAPSSASTSSQTPSASLVTPSPPRAQPAARPETAIRGHTSFLTFARRMIL